MTAFLKIDNCNACQRQLPWEWTPAVLLNGKPLGGTGVWRSQLIDGQCPTCLTSLEIQRQKEQRALTQRCELVQLLGGEKPYREFIFEKYEVTPGNRLAYERSNCFNPASDNLYLWGPCGVGKTHLAWAVARRCFEETLSVIILQPGELSRRVRMRDPEAEQIAVDQFVRAEMLLLDDIPTGSDTAFSRHILQEILDAREFHDRAGLVVTSQYSLDALAAKLGNDSIPSRLAGLCQVVEVKERDRRLSSVSGSK